MTIDDIVKSRKQVNTNNSVVAEGPSASELLEMYVRQNMKKEPDPQWRQMLAEAQNRLKVRKK